ncbi:MAG: hypothetical protein M3P11_08085 [Actinomycetota bacterium]|nr:hypothetical protein [Actinomycetota bacterium]
MSAEAARSDPRHRSLALDALRQGLAALGWTMLAAETWSFLAYFLAGRPFRAWSFVKIGWLYLLTFSRVGLDVTIGRSFSEIVNPGVAGESVYRVHLAFLLGSALAGWLLFRAGRAVASRVEMSPLGRAAIGAAIAPAYAVPLFLVSFLAVVRFPEQGVPDVRAVAWQALVFPLVMAAAFGAAGGLASASDEIRERRLGRWIVRWVEGGWVGLLAGLTLAFAGLLVLAAVFPDSTGAYARWLVRHGHVGALLFAHEVLSLPNHAMFVLAPSMGGCDTLSAAGSSAQMLCTGRFTSPEVLLYVPFVRGVPTGSDLGIVTGTLPSGTRMLLFAPFAATLLGARRAARGLERAKERIATGIGAGIAFAASVTVIAWASTASLRIPDTAAGRGIWITLGPDLLRTAALALGWGVVGGVIGAAIPDRSGRTVP